MAQITLPRASRRDDVPPTNARVVTPADDFDSGPRRGNVWLLRYIALVIGAAAAMALIGLCAMTTELEALRWKLSTAVDIERAHAMYLIREINSSVTPADISKMVREHNLTTKPAAVVHLRSDVPLPKIEATPITTPQPLANSARGGVEVVSAYRAGVK